ncbi:ExbD/TolR family protein [Methylohalobius crimeensis]|uniref:ExbD/TolR family protein n=1 Tax=Methylohalobius crimeensis TaxID=244365 RepID=UPI0003B49418|nr:biopolymer transporter ExbD [Methylohalobius crimeensis]
MRRRHRSNDNQDSGDINLTPMLDIIFIMLIFFIVTTSFVKEAGIQVNRPSAQTAERQERGNIIVAIRPNGEIWIDKRPVDIRAVRAVVARLKAENPLGTVVIAADREAKVNILTRVMDQIRLAGVTDMAIAAADQSR